jgi:hypothetical protein
MDNPSSQQYGLSRDLQGAKPSLHECLDTFMAQADTLIDGVIEGVAMATRGLVGANTSGMDVSLVRPLIGEIVANRPTVKQKFKASLHKGMYQGPGMAAQERKAVTYEELKFFEDDQLDASIEYARVLEDIERCVKEPLPRTHALMSAMLGWVSVQPSLNPVRPEVFARALCEAYADACASEPVGSPAREQVMTASAGHLGMGLARLYKQNMDWLRAAGVEPAGLGLDASAATSAPANAPPPPESSLAKTLLTLDRLRKLLTGQVEQEAPHIASLVGQAGGRDFLHTVPASMIALQDMKQVEALVEKLADKAKQPTTPAEAARQKALAVELRLGKQLGKHLGTEVIRLMVENLTQDERLLPPVRELMQQIEPQLIALGNKDQRFFSDRDHPARKLIDSVAYRSLGFTTTSDFGFPEFFQSVRVVLNSLRQPSDDVIGAFQAAQSLLDAAWRKQDEEDRKHQEEAAKALMHIEQRNLLAHHVAAEIKPKLSEAEIPANIGNFLVGPWAQVMAERQLRQLPNQERYTNLVENLIWSVQPKRARKNPARLMKLIPEMLGTMREGLRMVDYPDEMVSEFLDQLIKFHEAALESINRVVQAAADAKTAEQAEAAEAAEDSFWLAQKEALEAGFVMPDDHKWNLPDDSDYDQLPDDSMPVDGNWVDLWVSERWVRVNLKWTSPYKNLFLFVARDGETYSMTRKTLEKLKARNKLKVVSKHGVVDDALDRVANTALKNSVASR